MNSFVNPEEKYRILFDSIDEGFCIIQMVFDENKKPIDYIFLEINAAFERQTGLTNAVGKRMRELAPNHEEHWFQTYGKIALTGEPLRFEDRAEQLHRWYDVYAFRFGDPKNMQVGILFNDISSRRQTEEQLKIANKELESFSYSVSHDLRAPVRAIVGYSKILQEDFFEKLNDDGKQVIQTITNNAIKMGMLIDDLLAFSRLGRKELLKANVDLHKLTEDVVHEIKKQTSSSATVKIGSLPVVKGDNSLLQQVMLNLVSNAVKYSSKAKNPEVQIASTEEDGKVIISVKDNGAGFDMQYANKLFGVFQRLHTSQEFEGTGVGLAIVDKIISKHNGKVWAEGKVNQGATFYISLPK